MDDFQNDTPESAAEKLASRLQAAREKQAFGVTLAGLLGGGALGAGLGAANAPEGHRSEGAARGAVIGSHTGASAIAGGALGALPVLLSDDGTFGPTAARVIKSPLGPVLGLASVGIGAYGGGLLGNRLGRSLLSAPSWEQEQQVETENKKAAAAKQAFGMSDVTGWLNPQGTPDPSRWLAAGAGLGGLAGLGSSYMGDNEDRRPFSSALTGAIAGGAALGGGALVAPQLQSLWGQLKGKPSPAPAAAPPPDLHGLAPPNTQDPQQLRQWLESVSPEHAQDVQQWMGSIDPELRKQLGTPPSWADQAVPEIQDAAVRGAVGYGVGTLGQSAARTAINPLGRGADALRNDQLSAAAQQLAQGQVSNTRQLRGLWGAMFGRGNINPLGAQGEITEGLTNPEVMRLWRSGMRTPGQFFKSAPGMALGVGAAAAPYLMPHSPTVQMEELAR